MSLILGLAVLAGLPVLLVAFLFFVANPVLALGAALLHAFVLVSYLPEFPVAGPVELRTLDVAVVMAVYGVMAQMALARARDRGELLRFLYTPLLPFFVYVGLAIPVLVPNTGIEIANSVAAYLRLLVTVAIAPVIHFVVNSEGDARTLYRLLVAALVLSILYGVADAWLQIRPGAGRNRFGGLVGIDSFGLLCVLLIWFTVIQYWYREQVSLFFTLLLLALGGTGLYFTRSMTSFLALMGFLFIWFGINCIKKFGAKGVVLTLIIGVVGAAGFLGTMRLLRPYEYESVLALLRGGALEGSIGARILFAAIGFQLFWKNPVFGTGWSTVQNPTLIHDVDLSGLLEQFTHLGIFHGGTTSLHNAYAEILAETGLVGVAFLVGGAWIFGKRYRRVLNNRRLTRSHQARLSFYEGGILIVLLQYLGGPLIGGQTEAILLFGFLGLATGLLKVAGHSNRGSRIPMSPETS